MSYARHRASGGPTSTASSPMATLPSQWVCHGFAGTEGCTARPTDSGFCPAHEKQGVWLDPSAARISRRERKTHGEARHCSGLTQKMALCNNKTAGGGFRYCWLHGGQAVSRGVAPAPATGPDTPQRAIIRARAQEFAVVSGYAPPTTSSGQYAHALSPSVCHGFTGSTGCTSRPDRSGFCSLHVNQGAWLRLGAASISRRERQAHAGARLCSGVTQRDALCGNRVGGVFLYCHLHCEQAISGGVAGAGAGDSPQRAIIRARAVEFAELKEEGRAGAERQRRERELAVRAQQERQSERFQPSRVSAHASSAGTTPPISLQYLWPFLAFRAPSGAPSTPADDLARFDCSICLAQDTPLTKIILIINYRLTDCGNHGHGHKFCVSCIDGWIRSEAQAARPTCPLCRKPIAHAPMRDARLESDLAAAIAGGHVAFNSHAR